MGVQRAVLVIHPSPPELPVHRSVRRRRTSSPTGSGTSTRVAQDEVADLISSKRQQETRD